MKNFFLLTLVCLFSLTIKAEEKSIEKLRSRVQIKIQSFATNADGSKVLDIGSSTSIYSGQESLFSGIYKSQIKDLKDVILSFKIFISDDMTLKLDVAEYEHLDYDPKSHEPKFSGEVRKQSFAIKDFASVSWVSKALDDKNVVVRFLPQFSDDDPQKLKYTPLAFFDAVIVDNAGRIWSKGSGVTGEVSGIISPYGTVYLSYTEFPGSKEFGTAKDNDIDLKLTTKMNLKIRSSKPVLGFGYSAKVFGVYFPDKRGRDGITSMNVEDFEKQLKALSK